MAAINTKGEEGIVTVMGSRVRAAIRRAWMWGSKMIAKRHGQFLEDETVLYLSRGCVHVTVYICQNSLDSTL